MKPIDTAFTQSVVRTRYFVILLIISSLVVTCKTKSPEPLVPKARFRLAANPCTAPCDPGITNLSLYAQSYLWDFGDGGTATDETPKHTYAKGGTFALKLTVTGEQNATSDTIISVTIQSLAPTAVFTVQNDNCTAACEISFQNQSINALTYLWDFGDGGTSTEANPKHTYTKDGTYTAKLTATGDQAKVSSVTHTVTIKAQPLPVAVFTVQNDNCTAACEITFQNQSANALTYLWDFGDGGTATEASPKHTYTKGGTYTAKLTATGGQSTTASVSHTVTIKAQLVPVAAFTVQNDNCTAACEITFQNQSANALTYLWDFGDGSISTEASPKHTYTKGGIYTAKLTATGSQAKTASVSHTVTIKAQPAPVAAFLIQNDNCIAPCTVVFQNQSTNATTYSWKILTDYVVSKLYISGYAPVYQTVTTASPSQFYAVPAPYNLAGISGNQRLAYTAELTATGPGGTQTTSKTITIREPLPVADFTFNNSSSTGKIPFTNKSINATSYVWNFGNGTTSTDESPTGSYGSSGSYTVTLQATNSTGTSEVKKVVGVTVVR